MVVTMFLEEGIEALYVDPEPILTPQDNSNMEMVPAILDEESKSVEEVNVAKTLAEKEDESVN